MTMRIIKAGELLEEREIEVVTLERLERRLGEESNAVRLEIKDVRGDIKDLRSEMIDRQAYLLRWMLGFFVAQTAALGALLSVLR